MIEFGGTTGRVAPDIGAFVDGAWRAARLTALQRVVGGARCRVVWFDLGAASHRQAWVDDDRVRSATSAG